MTLTEIYAELQDIDYYLGNIDPRDELGTVTIRGRVYLEVDLLRKAKKRRAFLVAKLKRDHGIDYEAECRAERQRQHREVNDRSKGFTAALAQYGFDLPVRDRLEQLCQELHCEYLLAYGDKKSFFPNLADVWAALQRHPNTPDEVLKRFGLEHENPDLILDLMHRAGQP